MRVSKQANKQTKTSFGGGRKKENCTTTKILALAQIVGKPFLKFLKIREKEYSWISIQIQSCAQYGSCHLWDGKKWGLSRFTLCSSLITEESWACYKQEEKAIDAQTRVVIREKTIIQPTKDLGFWSAVQ